MQAERTVAEADGSDLARMEHKRSYASNQTAIAALELVTAVTRVLIRQHGDAFSDEVRNELLGRAAVLSDSDVEKTCTATIVTQMADWSLWATRR